MSARFLTWAYDVTLERAAGPTRAVQRAVLVNLAQHANKSGRTWPGVELICAETALGRRSVSAALTALERQGRITPVDTRSKGRHTTRWWLEPAAPTAHVVRGSISLDGHPTAHVVPSTAHVVPGNRAPRARRTRIEPSEPPTDVAVAAFRGSGIDVGKPPHPYPCSCRECLTAIEAKTL